MDFLNRAFNQVGELFRSMTPGARITAGLLLAVVVVSVGYLMKQGVGGPDDYLFWGQELSASELNALEASFAKANLSGWKIEANRIRVPAGQRGAYMGAAADGSALPVNFGDRFRQAVESNIFLSKPEREQRFKIALQDELSGMIRGMKGVERASVIYDVKEKSGLARETLATATVTVKGLGNQALEMDRVEDIRNLVASAIAGMKPDNVSVTDQNGRTYPATAGKAIAGELEYRRAMLAYEQDFKHKIDAALAYVVGALVSVHVEPDTKLQESVHQLSWDKTKSVPQVVDSKTTDENKQTSQPSGAPGMRSNSSANEGAEIAKTDKNSSTRNHQEERQVNMPGGSKTVTKTAGLVPKRVTVSVSVPRNYFEQVWRSRNNIPADQKTDATAVAALLQEESNKMREHVAQVLPPEVLGDPVRQVKITSFDVLPQAELPVPTTADAVLGWFSQYWGSVGMFGLGLFGLLLLRSIVRGGPAVEALPAPVKLHETPAAAGKSDEPMEEEKGDEHKRTLKWRRREGLSLKDELVELVREDPDTAAAILRTWIGSAG